MRLVGFLLVAAVGAFSVAAQTPNGGSSTPRTPDGHPDLEGRWLNDTLTPLERPKGFEHKEFFEPSEQQAFQRLVTEHQRDLLGEDNLKTSGDATLSFPERGPLWANRRTSLIIDPSNGRLPPRLPAAEQGLEALIQRSEQHGADGPEDFSDRERCRTWNSPPMLPPPSNNQIQIWQTREYIVLLLEMYGETRIVSMDGRPHLPATIRRLKGDPRGRWDGDTLVVETTNFVPRGAYSRTDPLNGLDESLRTIERFTLSDADTILYRFTVDDPSVYTSAWTAESPLRRSQKRMFEYACHEGNYSLRNSLSGARAEEQRGANMQK